jgi:hypothetical protein
MNESAKFLMLFHMMTIKRSTYKEDQMRTMCVFLYFLAMVTIAPMAFAQLPAQGGTFVKICSLHGEANQVQPAWHQDSTCNLPNLFPLDRNYHQQSARFGGGGANSDLQINDIPAGIHVDVSGNHYWAIVRPIRMVILDTDDPATTFGSGGKAYRRSGNSARSGWQRMLLLISEIAHIK